MELDSTFEASSRQLADNATPGPGGPGEFARGAVVGRYVILGKLGAGGMGVVYAAYDPELDRKIALKLVLPTRSGAVGGRVRLLREAQALARLSHPNVVTIHDVGVHEEQVWIAMEFVAGRTLGVWVRERNRRWPELLRVLMDVARGIAAAHSAGVIHRDLKPDNVMIGRDGRVRVMDFGLAYGRASTVPAPELAANPMVVAETRAKQAFATTVASDLEVRPEFAALAVRLTQAGSIQGTPAYMAPEQWQGKEVEAAADQFGWSVMAWELLHGERPFVGDTIEALAAAVLSGQRKSPSRSRGVPRWLRLVIERGLSTDPAERWSAMSELLAALERAPGSIYRRAAALTATVAVTGVASFALAATNAAEIKQCPDAHKELAGIWDEARVAAIQGAVRATKLPRAEEVLAAVEPRLERYAAAWVVMRNEACRTHAESRQSDTVFDLRTECLNQRRAGLDAVAEAFTITDGSDLASLAETAAGLPPLETCADTHALTQANALPDDPQLRARIQEHREKLARAQVKEDIGQYRLGLQLVESVLADAKAVAYEPLLAEAYLRKASIQMKSGDLAAEQSFDQALYTALGVDHESVAAQASSKRGYFYAWGLRRPDRAQAELPMMAALNRHVQQDVDLYAEFLNNTGAIQFRAGDLQSARRSYEEAHALREKHGRWKTPTGLSTLNNLARIAEEEGRYVDMEVYWLSGNGTGGWVDERRSCG